MLGNPVQDESNLDCPVPQYTVEIGDSHREGE